MKTFALLTDLCIVAISPFAATGTELGLSKKVLALDARAKAEVGVSLYALSLISRARQGGFFPRGILEASGEFARYQELERAGYLKLTVSNGLPDGSSRGTSFVVLDLTPKVRQLKAALVGP